MIKQFDNLSSWRKEEITIEPHELYTLNYRDTMPNIFVIVNPNECNLKLGITNLPRVDSYEFKVDYNSTETVGRPIGTHNLYILNDSSAKAKIIVFSIEKDFDPQILKNMNISLQGYTLETAAVIQGFAEGVSLPADPELLDSIANLKNVHLSNIHNKLTELLKENTYTEKTAAILSKLDTLISGQGSGGSGSGGSSYDDTELITLLTEWKGTDLDAWTLFGQVLNAINTYLSEININLDHTENYVKLIQESDLILRQVFSADDYKNSVYLNNVTSFSYTANSICHVHFGWLFYDGGTTATVKRNDTELLTIMKDERLTDIEFELNVNDVLTITSTEPMYRIKYWVR